MSSSSSHPEEDDPDEQSEQPSEDKIVKKGKKHPEKKQESSFSPELSDSDSKGHRFELSSESEKAEPPEHKNATKTTKHAEVAEEPAKSETPKKRKKHSKKPQDRAEAVEEESREAAGSRASKSSSQKPSRDEPKRDTESVNMDGLELKPKKGCCWCCKKDNSVDEAAQRLKEEAHYDEHAMSFKELNERYGSGIYTKDPKKSTGLSTDEAKKRLEENGKNVLTPPKQTPEIVKFLRQFINFFMILLNVAGVLSCVAYGLDKSQPVNLYLGIVLFVVVFLTCCSSYWQERSSSNVMKLFKTMLPPQCKVIRDGQEKTIKAEELVDGDIVRVNGGDKVPADLRLIKVSELKVENSSLTGEPDAIPCTVEKTDDRPTESKNITFNSSLCIEGEAYGVVIRTGDDTMIGRIAKLASQTTNVETTFQKEVKRVVYIIAAIAFTTAVAFFIIGMARSQPFVPTFVNGFIVVLVANIPQGLPATVTSLLTITARRLAKKNVFVKRLDVVETLGSTTAIATDKTGTLTENRMTVSHLWYDFHSHNRDRLTERKSVAFKNESFNRLYRIAALCNRAHWEEDPDAPAEPERNSVSRHNRSLEVVRKSMEVRRSMEMRRSGENISIDAVRKSVEMSRPRMSAEYGDHPTGRRSVEYTRDYSRMKIVGDASETALFRFCNEMKDIEAFQSDSAKVFEIPFNSTNKWQLSIHKVEVRSGHYIKERRLLVMKGAPEVIMARCSYYFHKGEKREVDDKFKEEWDSAYKRFGTYGERVLGFAELELDPKIYKSSMDKEYNAQKNNFPTDGLTFVGLISLLDPPRQGVKQAVSDCHTAGIRVIMVTGDHPFTAEAIAKKVGIVGEYLTAHDIADRDGVPVEEVNDDEVDAIVLHGQELKKFSQDDWDRVLSKQEIVFARTSPQQKLQIVENLQRLEEIVAVTGDGVNDSPALRKADIGVAMGKIGSDVAKEASDIIIMDDNFSSIVIGIKEGRIIFDNMRKTIAYTLTHLLPELIPVLLNLAVSLPLGLGSLLILCIDLLTELAPAVSLAYERPEADIMNRPPRNAKQDRLVTPQLMIYSYLIAGVFVTMGCILAYFLVYTNNGVPVHTMPFTSATYWNVPTVNSTNFIVPETGLVILPDEQYRIFLEAQTAYFINLVLGQFGHIWMCKTRIRSLFQHGIANMFTNIGVIVQLAIMVIVAYVPFIQPIVSSANVGALYWTPAIMIIGCLWIYNESRKAWARSWPNGMVAKLLMW